MTLKVLISIFLLQFSLVSFTQVDIMHIRKDYKKVRIGRKSATEIAQKVTKPYTDDESKFYAISFWIIRKIKYDYKLYRHRGNKVKTVDETLSSRKGVCSEFSVLLKEMCNAVNIPCEVVNGYSKDVDFLKNDSLFRAEHAWSAVKINDQWRLVDVTWANGGLRVKSNILRLILWKLFRIPYIAGLKYSERLTDYSWLNRTPTQFGHSHLPVLNEFQLLSPPIPIDSFEVGGLAIDSFMIKNNVKEVQSSKIDNYSSKSLYGKWKDHLEQGLENNNHNHRIAAISEVFMVDTLMRASFDNTAGLLTCDSNQLNKFKLMLTNARNNIGSSKAENKFEFEIKKERNGDWKKKLNKTNKEISKKVNTRIKLNKSQIKQFKKSKSKRKQLNKTLKSYKKTKYNKQFYNTKRPSKVKKANHDEAKSLINKADSLWRIQQKLRAKIDSLIEPFRVDSFGIHYLNEVNSKRMHRSNKRTIRQITAFPFARPVFHTDEFYTQKDWFIKTHLSADSLNKRYGKLLTDQNINTLLLLKHELKLYSKQQKVIFKLLKRARKVSFKNQGEVEKHKEILNEYRTGLDSIKWDLKLYFNFRANLKFNLKRENKILKKSLKRIKIDGKLEAYRHAKYQEYRSFIKAAEDNRLKLLKDHVKYLEKIVEKTEKKRSKEK